MRSPGRLSILIALVLVCTPLRSASASLDGAWGVVVQNSAGTPNVDVVTTDAAGNIYVAGTFTASTRIAGGPLMTAGAGTGTETFVAKLTSAGAHVWSTWGGGNGLDTIFDIAVSPSGLVAVGGLTGSSTFSLGGAPIATNGSNDGFVTTFNSAGAHSFTRVFGGSFSDWVTTVDFDASNQVVCAGQFRNTVNFGTGNIASKGGYDFFLLRLTLWGATSAAVGFGTAGNEEAPRIDLDPSGNIAFTGRFENSIDVGNGALASNGAGDMLVAQFPSVGAAANWSVSHGGTGSDFGNDIVTDADGNVFVCGGFHGTVDFAPGEVTSDGGTDGFVAGFKGVGGATLWVRRYGGSGEDYGNGIALLGTRIAVAGQYQSTADFGSATTTAQAGYDAFLFEVDTEGDWECFLAGRGSQDNAAGGVAFSGEPVLASNYFSTMAWGTLGLQTNFGNFAGSVVKMGQPAVSSADPVPVPPGFLLSPAYPNPLQHRTRLAFRFPGAAASGPARVLDVQGRLVRELAISGSEEGTLIWDGRGEDGAQVGSGVYFIRVTTTGGAVLQRRVTVVR